MQGNLARLKCQGNNGFKVKVIKKTIEFEYDQFLNFN